MLFILFCYASNPEQRSINVNVYVSGNSVVRQFEVSFLNAIVDLHNSHKKTKLKLNILSNSSYDEITTLFATDTISQYSIGVAGLTINRNKTWVFSESYLPVHNSVIKLKRRDLNLRESGLTLTHLTSKTYTEMAEQLKAKFKLNLLPVNSYREMEKLVVDGYADFYLGDSLDGWLNPKTEVLFNIHTQPKHIGFVMPKHSKLKEMLDPFINYFKHTKGFYKLLKTFFGEEFSIYYRKSIQS